VQCLLAYLDGEGIIGIVDASRVHHQIGRMAHASHPHLDIAGDTGNIGDQRIARTREPVEKRRLADIGPANQGQGRLGVACDIKSHEDSSVRYSTRNAAIFPDEL
jgi:hypothetical protein